MDNTFYHKIRYKNTIRKIIAYTSAAMIFTAVPALSASAVETDSQTATPPANTPTQQESQPADAANTITATPQAPTDATNTVTVTPQAPTDATETVTVTPQAPTDAATVTPPPAPTDQGAFEVTPMQGTVYAAIPGGVNVRSGPSTDYAKLGESLKYGESVTITGTVSNWYQIQYSGGVGYVRSDLVSSTPPDTAQNSAGEPPAAEPPAAENPTVENPPADTPDIGADNDLMTDEEDSTDEDNYVEITSRHLLGTPVLVGLSIAVVGVIALICYSVYSLFKKETDTEEYEDEYYEDEEYDDAQYSETEYYEEEPYSDEEYYEEEQYSDEEYYEEEPYSDEEYYEDQPYSDEEYYEERDQYSEYEYPEDKDNK